MKMTRRIVIILICISTLITSIPLFASGSDFNFNKLKSDYASKKGISAENVIIESDYGSYNGDNRVVILGIKGEEKGDEPYDLYIGDLCFRFSSEAYANRFLYYRKETYGWNFYTVKEAYEKNYISSKTVYELALLHGVETYSPEELKVEDGGIEWSFDPVNGKLTVEGEGEMPDYKLIGGRTTSPSSNWRYGIRKVEMKYSESVGAYAFYNCENLVSADLRSYTVSIGRGAFEGCSSLTEIEIPDYTYEISSDTFKNCKSLTKVDLHENVRRIKENAFEGCSSLKEFDFPEGMSEISDNAFVGCDSLEKLNFYGKPPKKYSGIPDNFKGEMLYPDDISHWTENIRTAISDAAAWSTFNAPEIKYAENYFDDVIPGSWYVTGIRYGYSKKYISGTGNYRFEPNKTLTREETAMLLYKYKGKGETYEEYSFDDVVPGAWYADAVEWMYQKGYTAGISYKEFGVSREVTRQDLVTLMYNVHEDRWTSEDYFCRPETIESFSDYREVSPYALKPMIFATGVYHAIVAKWDEPLDPIICGNNGKIMPKATCTRAEAVAIMQRSAYVYDIMDVFLIS